MRQTPLAISVGSVVRTATAASCPKRTKPASEGGLRSSARAASHYWLSSAACFGVTMRVITFSQFTKTSCSDAFS